MTDFSGDSASTPNGLPTTKSPPPFPPRDDRADRDRVERDRAERERVERERVERDRAERERVERVEDVPTMARERAAVAPSPAAQLQQVPPAPTPDNGGGRRFPAEVKGRIDVADEVVEKVAALAAIEVEGVADLGGDVARAIESVRERIGIGQRRGDQGVKADVKGREVSVDVTIVIEYGHIVMEVARNVKNNVAYQTNRMLGLNVVEVNVTVDDVKLPETARRDESQEPDNY